MRLGTETNSLVNHMLSRGTIGQPTPEVGMGATVLAWTDRHPGTIRKVQATKTGWIVRATEDDAARIDANGMSECQRYEFTPNENGREWWFSFDERGWRQVELGDANRFRLVSGGKGLRIGERGKYYDFSF